MSTPAPPSPPNSRAHAVGKPLGLGQRTQNTQQGVLTQALAFLRVGTYL